MKPPATALERLDWWSWRATIIIFVGIAIEAWGSIHFWSRPPSIPELLTTLTADGLIGGGLLIEAVCIVRAIVWTKAEKQEADKEIAAANERAAAANLETERLRQGLSWRLLRPSQKARITERMKQYAGQEFIVITYREIDHESFDLGLAIEACLTEAGWRCLGSGILSWRETGISVESGEGPNSTRIEFAAHDLTESLNEEGLSTKQTIKHPVHNEHNNAVVIVVGRKPPTGLELPGRGLALDPSPLQE